MFHHAFRPSPVATALGLLSLCLAIVGGIGIHSKLVGTSATPFSASDTLGPPKPKPEDGYGPSHPRLGF